MSQPIPLVVTTGRGDGRIIKGMVAGAERAFAIVEHGGSAQAGWAVYVTAGTGYSNEVARRVPTRHVRRRVAQAAATRGHDNCPPWDCKESQA